jgi:hypothetical protein
MSEDTFERDLRLVLRDLAPVDAPASLREAVAAVPRTHPLPRRAVRASNRGRFLAFAGLAAVIAVAAVGLALALGGGLLGNVAAPSPSSASPATSWIKLTYAIGATGQGASAKPSPDPDTAATVMEIVTSRLESERIPYNLTEGISQFSLAVPADRASDVEKLVGTTASVVFVPLGNEPVSAGASLDLSAHPKLFGEDAITSAAIGTDQTGQRTVDLTLSAAATTTFATYTATHIGEYFAVVLDGQVIIAPVIQTAIPNGQVQIETGDVGGWDLAAAQRFITWLQFGSLPAPIIEVGSETVAPPEAPWTPAPLASDSPTSAPSLAASPLPSQARAEGVVALAPVAKLPAGGFFSVARASWGYVGMAQTGQLLTDILTSPDGSTWSAWPGGHDALGVLSGQVIARAAPCGSGVIAMVARSDGTASAFYTADGKSLTPISFDLAKFGGPLGLAGDAQGAVIYAPNGHVGTSRDCTTFAWSDLPAGDGLGVRGGAVIGSRFVVVGFSGSSDAPIPAIWWSDDGAAWHDASLTVQGGAFMTDPAVGSGGAVAEAQSSDTPYKEFFRSSDGISWVQLPSPMGGTSQFGVDAGSVTGDGTHVLFWGAAVGLPSTTSYWVGDGGDSYVELSFAGDGTDIATATGQVADAVLLRDGMLIFGQTGKVVVATGPLP